MLLLALAFVLTAGIGITLGSWLGFPGQAESGQQAGAGSAADGIGSGRGRRAHAGDRRGAHASDAARDTAEDPQPGTGPDERRPSGPPGTCRRRAARSSARCRPSAATRIRGSPRRSSRTTARPTPCTRPTRQRSSRRTTGVWWSTRRTAGRRRRRRTARKSPGTTSACTPRRTPIQQLETGKLNAASQAAGRMFCNYNSTTNTENIIWTETDGNMLGEVHRITAPGRVELVAARPPQHRLQRTADGRHGHGTVRLPQGLGQRLAVSAGNAPGDVQYFRLNKWEYLTIGKRRCEARGTNARRDQE